jgi:hypothetical protein
LRSLHIAHIIPGLEAAMGGPVFALVGLACAQAKAGMKVTVVSAVAPGNLPAMVDQLKQAGAHFIPIV